MSTKISTAATFQFTGLASGIDSGAIIDQLMEVNALPIKKIESRQADYEVQISTLGTMITQLKALDSAAAELAKNGTVAIQPNDTYNDFKVSGSGPAEGSYNIQVERLAREVKFRSARFDSAQIETIVPDGNLQFSIDGTNSVVISTTGKTLADVAEAINLNVSQVSATVVSTGDGYYLNISRKTTGYSITAEDALVIVQDPGLVFAQTQAAQNSKVWVDGLAIERSTNTVTDVIDGVTLTLTGDTNVSERVVFVANSSETETKLQGFITAYNELATTIRNQLVTDPNSSYGETLVNGTMATSIQREMQRMLSSIVIPTGGVRTLADLGMEIQRDGTISLNAFQLADAIDENPEAVNSIFSNSTTGIAEIVEVMVKNQTAAGTGVLVQRKSSLTESIADMDVRIESIQSRLDAERERLVTQFSAMEILMSSLQGLDTYLSNLANFKLGSE